MTGKRSAFAMFFILVVVTGSRAQKHYTTTGWEFIYSLSNYTDSKDSFETPSPRIRASMFFHTNQRYHYDFGTHIGMFTGYSIRNVGFSVKYNDTLTKKHRVYTFGVPVALKIGNMESRRFFYLGAEGEFAFNYKEKTYLDGDKKKFNEWFSSRTPLFMPSVFAGVQLKKGFNIYAKYYLMNFLNADFQTKGVKPYLGVDAQVFYISLSYNTKKKKGSLRKKGEHAPTITKTRFI